MEPFASVRLAGGAAADAFGSAATLLAAAAVSLAALACTTKMEAVARPAEAHAPGDFFRGLGLLLHPKSAAFPLAVAWAFASANNVGVGNVAVRAEMAAPFRGTSALFRR